MRVSIIVSHISSNVQWVFLNENILLIFANTSIVLIFLKIFSNHSNNNGKNVHQQENWPAPDQPVQHRRRSHYVVEVSRRCSTSSDAPNRSQQQQQQQQHCKQHNFTSRASQRSASQGKYKSRCVVLSLERADNFGGCALSFESLRVICMNNNGNKRSDGWGEDVAPVVGKQTELRRTEFRILNAKLSRYRNSKTRNVQRFKSVLTVNPIRTPRFEICAWRDFAISSVVQTETR